MNSLLKRNFLNIILDDFMKTGDHLEALIPPQPIGFVHCFVRMDKQKAMNFLDATLNIESSRTFEHPPKSRIGVPLFIFFKSLKKNFPWMIERQKETLEYFECFSSVNETDGVPRLRKKRTDNSKSVSIDR